MSQLNLLVDIHQQALKDLINAQIGYVRKQEQIFFEEKLAINQQLQTLTKNNK